MIHPSARSVLVSLVLSAMAGCATPGGKGLQGRWSFRITYGYHEDLLSIRDGPQSSINPAYLAVYPKRWVIMRTKRRYLARTFAAVTRGSSVSGTVQLRDGRTGKRFAGRYARQGEWLDLHFVPGTVPPRRIVRRSGIKGAMFARLRWAGGAPGLRHKQCPPLRRQKAAFHSPRATFETLLLALRRGDAALLARCFAHPLTPERARRLLDRARRHLWRSCFVRQRRGRQYLRFWYRVTDPRDHKRTWQDRGRMLRVGGQWKIYKL